MNMPTISADFPFASKYIEVHGSRMHYIDEGSGDPILFLHGNPASLYIWRNIIPHLTPLGRCIAPDLIGMGKSDNPDSDYRFFSHVRYLRGFINGLGLKRITLVLHNWGSALGFHYAMSNQDNIKAMAFMEAMLLPNPGWENLPAGSRKLFKYFRTPDLGWQMIVNNNMFIEQLLPSLIMRELSSAEMNQYREPFLNSVRRKAIWRWCNEIPIGGEPADVTLAFNDFRQKLCESALPKLLLYATPGVLIPAPLVAWCQKNLKNLHTVNIGKGLHYIQEDNPHLIGTEIASWYGSLA